MTTERPVPSGENPENFVLTEEQKQQQPPPIPYLLSLGVYLTSGLLPSGQENYFDESQSPENNANLPINTFYPSPVNNIGLLATYPPSGFPPEILDSFNLMKNTGIFHYNNLSGNFSNVIQVSGLASQDFDIFNSYIHYYPNQNPSQINIQNKTENFQVEIPYISDYEIVKEPFNPY